MTGLQMTASQIYARQLLVLRNLVPMLARNPAGHLFSRLGGDLELGIPLSAVTDRFEGVFEMSFGAISTQACPQGEIRFPMPVGIFRITGDPHAASRRAAVFGIERNTQYPQNYPLPPYIQHPLDPEIQRVSVLEVFGGDNPVVRATDYMCVDSLRRLVLGEGNFEPHEGRCFARIGRAPKVKEVHERLRSHRTPEGNEPQILGWPVASLMRPAELVGFLIRFGVLTVHDYLGEVLVGDMDAGVIAQVGANAFFDLPRYKHSSFVDFVGDDYPLTDEIPDLGREHFERMREQEG